MTQIYEHEVPVLSKGQTSASATSKISGLVLERRIHKSYLLVLLIAFSLVTALGYTACYLVVKGIGIWGVNIPVAWGFAIVNFVWWIGIGHAGTFISAMLLLMRQDWRTSINRFAEAMTLFAVACAGMFPLLHLGRPWVFYWLVPYPNTMKLWPHRGWVRPGPAELEANSEHATAAVLQAVSSQRSVCRRDVGAAVDQRGGAAADVANAGHSLRRGSLAGAGQLSGDCNNRPDSRPDHAPAS